MLGGSGRPHLASTHPRLAKPEHRTPRSGSPGRLLLPEVKEQTGKLTDDESMENEGRAEEASADVKEKAKRSGRSSIVRRFVGTQEVEELPDLVVVLSGMTHRR